MLSHTILLIKKFADISDMLTFLSVSLSDTLLLRLIPFATRYGFKNTRRLRKTNRKPHH